MSSSRYEKTRAADPLSVVGEVGSSRRVVQGVNEILGLIYGTENQVIITPSGATIILSTPQDIDIDAAVVFASLELSTFLRSKTALVGGIIAGHYTGIGDDGKVQFYGDARVKNTVKVFSSQDLQLGAVPPSAGVLGAFPYDEYTIDDDSILSVPPSPSREPNTDIEVVISWGIDEAYATASGEIQWRIDWSAAAAGIGLDNPSYSGTVLSGDINIPATAKALTRTTLTIPGTNIGQNDEVGITLKRVAIDGGANPTAEPGIVSVQVKCLSNKIGEYIKWQ